MWRSAAKRTLSARFRSLEASEALVLEKARRTAPGRRLAVGVSDHAGPRRGDLEFADFATLAPWAEVPGKGLPWGLRASEHASRIGSARVVQATWALGGLGPNDLSSVRDAGAQGAFVIRGMDWDGRPDRAVEKLLGAWGLRMTPTRAWWLAPDRARAVPLGTGYLLLRFDSRMAPGLVAQSAHRVV